MFKTYEYILKLRHVENGKKLIIYSHFLKCDKIKDYPRIDYQNLKTFLFSIH